MSKLNPRSYLKILGRWAAGQRVKQPSNFKSGKCMSQLEQLEQFGIKGSINETGANDPRWSQMIMMYKLYGCLPDKECMDEMVREYDKEAKEIKENPQGVMNERLRLKEMRRRKREVI